MSERQSNVGARNDEPIRPIYAIEEANVGQMRYRRYVTLLLKTLMTTRG